MTPLLQITAAQLLFYAPMWGVAWLVMSEERRAIRQWAAYDLSLALGA